MIRRDTLVVVPYPVAVEGVRAYHSDGYVDSGYWVCVPIKERNEDDIVNNIDDHKIRDYDKCPNKSFGIHDHVFAIDRKAPNKNMRKHKITPRRKQNND